MLRGKAVFVVTVDLWRVAAWTTPPRSWCDSHTTGHRVWRAELPFRQLSRCTVPGGWAHAVLRLDRAAWHTTSHLVVPEVMTLIFLPSRASAPNPPEPVEGRDRLARPAGRPAPEPRLRRPSGHCRRRLRGLGQVRRPAPNHHIHRPAGLDAHRSNMKAVGMITSEPDRVVPVVFDSEGVAPTAKEPRPDPRRLADSLGIPALRVVSRDGQRFARTTLRAGALAPGSAVSQRAVVDSVSHRFDDADFAGT